MDKAKELDAQRQLVNETVQRTPLLAAHQLENSRKLNAITDLDVFLAVTESLQFLSRKSILTQELFDWLIDNESLIPINQLLRWLYKINANSSQALTFVERIKSVSNIEKVSHRIEELKTQAIIDVGIDFPQFLSLISLIAMGLDEIKYIEQLKKSDTPVTLLEIYNVMKNNDLLADNYHAFVVRDDSFPWPKMDLLLRLKNNNLLNLRNFNLCRQHENVILLSKLIERI